MVTLSVVRGEPTAEEVAAVVAVLGARARAGAALASGPALARASRSHWADAARLMREPAVAGPGAWKRSVLPR